MNYKKNLVWVLLAYGLLYLAFKNKKRTGKIIVNPLDKGEFLPDNYKEYQD